MTTSIHYVNGCEAARTKLGFLDDPNVRKLLALHAATGGLGGAAIGAGMADEGERLEGAAKGGLAGAAGGAGWSLARHGLTEGLQNLVRPSGMDDATHAALKARANQMPMRHPISEGLQGALYGATPAMMASEPGLSAAVRSENTAPKEAQQKLAFGDTALALRQALSAAPGASTAIAPHAADAGKKILGFGKEQLQHAGLRAAGGAAAGAGIGAIAGGEDNRLQGALAGGAMGGLAAGGASLGRKGLLNKATGKLDQHVTQMSQMPGGFSPPPMTPHNMQQMQLIQALRNEPSRVNAGLTGAGMGRTMAGGAAMGALPAMAAGRMTRDE